MTETPELPPELPNDHVAAFPQPSPQAPQPAVTQPNAAAPSRVLPILGAVGFLILAGAIYFVWQNPKPSADTTAETQRTQALDQQVSGLDARLNRIEQRPAPVTMADIGKLTARVDSVDGRVSDQSQMAGRLDTLSGRIESLSGRDQSGQDTLKQQLDELTGRIAALEKAAGNLDAVSERLNRIARIQEAGIAMAAGRPTGDVPNAPPALAKFAHTAAPTEAQLRLLFVQAEHAALEARQPDDTAAPLMDRVLERAQNLVTIRRGDDVVVGNAASVVLNQARAALDAGDLKSAISVVETLKDAPRQAMNGWLVEARSLLDARAALADMAAQA